MQIFTGNKHEIFSRRILVVYENKAQLFIPKIFYLLNEYTFGSSWEICSAMYMDCSITYTFTLTHIPNCTIFVSKVLVLGLIKPQFSCKDGNINPWKIICSHKLQKDYSEIYFIKCLHMFIILSTDYLLYPLKKKTLLLRFIEYVNIESYCHLRPTSHNLPLIPKTI